MKKGFKKRLHPIKSLFSRGDDATKTLGQAAKGGWAATRGFKKPNTKKFNDSGKFSQADY